VFAPGRASAAHPKRHRPRPASRILAVAGAAAMMLGASPQGIAASADGPAHGRHDVDAGAYHARKAPLQVLDKPADRFRRSLKAASRELRRTRTSATEASGAYPASDTVGVEAAALEQIAFCESGGDPTAVSADGAHRGKYQFDYGTWAAVGGSGDPAAAPEAEQDYRAALLYAQGGPGHWPNCA
jgi:Transglycosylase-like domain